MQSWKVNLEEGTILTEPQKQKAHMSEVLNTHVLKSMLNFFDNSQCTRQSFDIKTMFSYSFLMVSACQAAGKDFYKLYPQDIDNKSKTKGKTKQGVHFTSEWL